MDLRYWEEFLLNREKELKKQIEDLSSEVSGEDLQNGRDHSNNDAADDAWSLLNHENATTKIIALKDELHELRHALYKIREKQDLFGICEKCNKSIEIERLKVRPWARYCYKCKYQVDHAR